MVFFAAVVVAFFCVYFIAEAFFVSNHMIEGYNVCFKWVFFVTITLIVPFQLAYTSNSYNAFSIKQT